MLILLWVCIYGIAKFLRIYSRIFKKLRELYLRSFPSYSSALLVSNSGAHKCSKLTLSVRDVMAKYVHDTIKQSPTRMQNSCYFSQQQQCPETPTFSGDPRGFNPAFSEDTNQRLIDLLLSVSHSTLLSG